MPACRHFGWAVGSIWLAMAASGPRAASWKAFRWGAQKAHDIHGKGRWRLPDEITGGGGHPMKEKAGACHKILGLDGGITRPKCPLDFNFKLRSGQAAEGLYEAPEGRKLECASGYGVKARKAKRLAHRLGPVRPRPAGAQSGPNTVWPRRPGKADQQASQRGHGDGGRRRLDVGYARLRHGR